MPICSYSALVQLQFGDQPASTKDLLTSLGWGTDKVFTHRDEQELNWLLVRQVEEKLKVREGWPAWHKICSFTLIGSHLTPSRSEGHAFWMILTIALLTQFACWYLSR